MISPSTAALAISVARGIIKFGHRLDALVAEREAVQGALVLLMPEIYNGPTALQKVRELKEYLAGGDGASGDPLGDTRSELLLELAKEAPDGSFVGNCYRRVFPERLIVAPLRPDAEYVTELRRRLPQFDLSDPDLLAAAFHISAGKDDRELGYAARIGLLVADVLSEFGAENTALLVRDPALRGAVQSILERFASPDLEEFSAWSPLLRHALSASLNGMLDHRGLLTADSRWLLALMDVLATARGESPDGDEFLAGLFQGRGYPLLVGKGLQRASELLGEDQANSFKQLASDVLKHASPLVSNSPTFKQFFADHWGDLLRAGLEGMGRYGPLLLDGQPELLRDVLLGMVTELNEIPDANLLSNETLFRIGDAAIAAVAAKPGLLAAKAGNQPWLRAFLNSFVSTVARDGIQASFSRQGLEEMVTEVAGVFGAHPELIIESDNAELARTVVGGVLNAVHTLSSLDARTLAAAATSGMLQAFAQNPSLVKTRYATLIADFSASLAELVKAQTLTGLNAAALMTAASEAVAQNPELFDRARSNIATAVLNAVVRAAGSDEKTLLSGAVLVATVHEVLRAAARSGRARIENSTTESLTDALTKVVDDSLVQARAELGTRLDLSGVPWLVGGLVAAWGRGEFARINPESAAFKKLFGRLLETAASA
ncbi:MAG TPA: hypothetical protein VEH04_20925 [Verrucomicrobiae bacterium]|nr:hypothetical protein [Verrucomicrobiae bacterium]